MNVALAAAALLAGVTATGTVLAQARPSPFGNFELRIEQVADDLYMIRSSASGNMTVFTSDDAVLIVDSKFANENARAMELLRTVTDLPVKYVVNTHMHGDHTGGNIAFEAQGSDIVATENARRRMAGAQAMGLPSITFDDRLRIYFGERVMDFYWFGRGHTDGAHGPSEDASVSRPDRADAAPDPRDGRRRPVSAGDPNGREQRVRASGVRRAARHSAGARRAAIECLDPPGTQGRALRLIPTGNVSLGRPPAVDLSPKLKR